MDAPTDANLARMDPVSAAMHRPSQGLTGLTTMTWLGQLRARLVARRVTPQPTEQQHRVQS